MSNYTKTTDFEAKDSLPTGDSGKIIRGAEFETEFDAISTAIATKADTAGPTFTGTATFATISDGTIAVTAFVDEDDMSSNSATLVPTQQSVKAYVDSVTTELQAQDLDFQADSGGALNIDLDTETMTFTGGTGIDTTGSGNDVSFAIDSTVTTLTGTQTLTNKTLTSPDVNTPDIDGGTIDGTVIGGTTAAAVSATTVSATGNITVGGTVDGRDVATDGTKLDTVETNADVTDTTNVTAAGALMDSEVTNLAQVKAFDSADYATAAQGTTADAALPKTGGAMTGAITTNSTFDGRDVATDGTKLDGIEASADVTDTTNVTAAGALMDSELTDLTAVKALNQGVATTDSPTFAGLTTTADVSFGDNDKAIFGAGSDLQIYHDGGNSRILENGTGFLAVGTNGTDIRLTGNSFTEFMAKFEQDGPVTLYHNNAAKLATTSTGIDVTGTVTADGLTVNGTTDSTEEIARFGNNAGTQELIIEQQGSTGYAIKSSTDLRFHADYDNDTSDGGSNIEMYTDGIQRMSITGSTGDISFYEDTGTTAKFFWDASAESLTLGNGGSQGTLNVGSAASAIVARFTDETTSSVVVRPESGGAIIGTDGGGTLHLAANGSTLSDRKMTITTTGNVGIGTSSPAQALHVVGAIKVSDGILNSGVGGSASIFNEDGTTADFRVESSGNTHMLFVDGGLNKVGIGTSSPNSIVDIRENATGGQARLRLFNTDQTNSTAQSALLFISPDLRANGVEIAAVKENADFSAAADRDIAITFSPVLNNTATERMRIDSNGNLLVGTTSTVGAGSAKLEILGGASGGRCINTKVTVDTSANHITFHNGNGQVGFINTTGTTTAYNTSSDERLKENIADADDAGSKIDAVQVRKYDWKADGSHQDYGMIAQELLEVAPEAVSVPEDPEDMLGVDYSKLVPMLVKEIQSLRARVAQLETN